MAKFIWSETFISLEGESVSPIGLGGHPTVYVRLSGCNFTCQKFNNPDNVPITNEVLGFNPKDYTTLKDIPLISMGCDSLYAHDSRFKHLWKRGDENVLAKELIDLLPHNKWIHPDTGLPYILSITGGEPTIFQKDIPDLLQHPLLNDLRILLIETNGSLSLKDKFLAELERWVNSSTNRTLIWSNSPKLSASGEDWGKAIKPEVIKQQTQISGNVKQYFKFVVGPKEQDFLEVAKAMNEYYSVGIPRNVPVGIMPEAATADQQNEIARQVAQMCIERGYVYTCRLQNYLWGNDIGT